MASVVIREYGLLARQNKVTTTRLSFDSQVIPARAWDWLLSEACGGGKHKQLVRPRVIGGQLHLQVLNYVGSVITPCGSHIEILPKHSGGSSAVSCRRLLLKMLNKVYGLNIREFEQAHIQLMKKPLPEVLIEHFLLDVKKLIRCGIRSDYRNTRDEIPYLRGRLHMSAQLRQAPERQHYFQVNYDEYLPDRAENRLIHSSLKQVMHWSQSSDNQRLARELVFFFDDIPISSNHTRDLSRWQTDRTMQHYRLCQSWCEFILNEQSPLMLAGEHLGQSFLFPMNDLFEKYVARVLEQQLVFGFRIKEQAASRYLVDSHNNKKLFQLRPDILIKQQNKSIAVLDCKWKLLDQNKNHNTNIKRNTYGVSQEDIYQLYAYGRKYLDGVGVVFLVYPQHSTFDNALPIFQYDENLSLWVVPFDLEKDRILFPDSLHEKYKFI